MRIPSWPRGARWNDDGSYVLPPEAPKTLAPDEPAAGTTSLSHGPVVHEASYLGCRETVYEDGWASDRAWAALTRR